jgi:hypothetical protein
MICVVFTFALNISAWSDSERHPEGEPIDSRFVKSMVVTIPLYDFGPRECEAGAGAPQAPSHCGSPDARVILMN